MKAKKVLQIVCALDFAAWAHSAQRRKGGEREPYVNHLTEVARLVAQGLPNKLVARELDISEKTVHIHRQHVMEKAEVGSAAELARLMLQADPTALD
mgnify:CR=1 FL=1